MSVHVHNCCCDTRGEGVEGLVPSLGKKEQRIRNTHRMALFRIEQVHQKGLGSGSSGNTYVSKKLSALSP
jgi:hypothetical protein